MSVKLKNELIEIILTMKQMLYDPILMILNCLWIVITFQEKSWIKNVKTLAEEDRLNMNHQMPNPFIQGVGLTVRQINFDIRYN
jgi:hypothetical protein